jgi:hypothetical protein
MLGVLMSAMLASPALYLRAALVAQRCRSSGFSTATGSRAKPPGAGRDWAPDKPEGAPRLILIASFARKLGRFRPNAAVSSP